MKLKCSFCLYVNEKVLDFQLYRYRKCYTTGTRAETLNRKDRYIIHG